MCADGRCMIIRCAPGYCDHDGRDGCEWRICYHSHGWACEPECHVSSYEF